MTRTRLPVILGLMVAGATPARGEIRSSDNGYMEPPDEGATYTRPAGAPHALVGFLASGMEVRIEGAAPNQRFHVQPSFYLELNGNPLDAELPGQFISQADARGRWWYYARGTGVLQQFGRGVPPGSHVATITSDLVVLDGRAPNATFTHSHTFSVQ